MVTAFLQRIPGVARVIGIGPVLPATLPSPVSWFTAGHPVPDQRSVAAAHEALQVAGRVRSDDALVVLLSGGASALMALPAQDITLEDKQDTVRRLLKAGATIHELNTVRKHLSAIKGGRLAVAAAAPVVTLVISDVVGDDLSVIGSGPTMPDPSTFDDALRVLDVRGGRAAYHAAVVSYLERGAHGDVAETPKPDDPRMTRSFARIIGGRMTAVAGAAEAARNAGYAVHIIDTPIVGEAREASSLFAQRVRDASARSTRPACVIGAGETTVHVTGDGLGGRNQEFALAMLPFVADFTHQEVHGHPQHVRGTRLDMVFGSIGTDGIDGPTDAAGALIDATSHDRAAARGIDPAAYLRNNDSYHFFSALDDLILTGPTGTNVGDVQVALIAS
jgi:hydroxypyruvate reductase